MDDEKYFVLMAIMSGIARYCANDKAKCSDDVHFIGKEKCSKKILM